MKNLGSRPAFPLPKDYVLKGLTKREYFAGLAMQGILANPHDGAFNRVVAVAVEYADALLAELEKEQKQ